MTSSAFILGCLPLWFAAGSGAISRQTLGTVVIGGMLGATFVDTLIVPVTFCIVEKLAARYGKNGTAHGEAGQEARTPSGPMPRPRSESERPRVPVSCGYAAPAAIPMLQALSLNLAIGTGPATR